VTALWGVIIGGLLTICGQLAAEAWKGRVAGTERAERRAAISRDYQRQAATQLEYDALAYRRALVDNERQEVPTAEAEDGLRLSRASYEAALYRVESADCRGRFIAWEKAAVAWAQEDGPAKDEVERWRAAMEAGGAAIRSNL
jgi:hypothetical protein